MSESAYAFRSNLSLEDILARLQSQPTERWRAVDSDRREDLYVTNTPEGQAKYRIFPDRERYVIDIDVLDDPVAFSRAHDRVQREILPLLEAYDIAPHPGWE